jgi:hypothetical protein
VFAERTQELSHVVFVVDPEIVSSKSLLQFPDAVELLVKGSLIHFVIELRGRTANF